MTKQTIMSKISMCAVQGIKTNLLRARVGIKTNQKVGFVLAHIFGLILTIT